MLECIIFEDISYDISQRVYFLFHMLTGAPHYYGDCECSNSLIQRSGRDKCTVNLHEICRDESGFFFPYIKDECRDEKCQCSKGFNVCRRDSIYSENIDYVIESNHTLSVGTQTPLIKDAIIQTSQSLESLTESPSDLNSKFGSFSNRHMRNFNEYNKLDNSENTRNSSFESSFKDESTQFGESNESEHTHVSYSGHKIFPHCRKLCCNHHDAFFPKDNIRRKYLMGNLNRSEESYVTNGNIIFKCQNCVCTSAHFFPEKFTKNSFHPRSNQCTSESAFCDKSTPIICPYYRLSKFEPNDQIFEFEEKHFEKYDGIKENQPQQQIYEYSSNYFAQTEKDWHKKSEECEESKNCAFTKTADCKLEVLDENTKSISTVAKDSFIENNKTSLQKAKEYDEKNAENEQCTPLLNNNIENGVKDEIDKNHIENAVVEVENGDREYQNEICHCKHEYSPDNVQNGIRIRPSKKKSSKSTSPLKVITLLLFASAFLITGSALKDAYYNT